MSLLTIELLGPPRLAIGGGILTLRMRKELALLAYVAVEQQHPHSRETLVGLLWPDVPEEAARNNLRVTLASLRRLLGAAGDAFLRADRQHVQFLPGSDHTLDAITFRRLLLDVRAHPHAAPERCDACIARLAEAVVLYRGDFLAGFSLPDSVPFDEWATIEREQLRQQLLDALDTLTTAYELRGDYAAQCTYARRQLAMEPWHESAHAQLIRGLWASGQRGAALEQYEACRRILADELGLEPSPELAALAEQLRAAPRAAAVGEGREVRQAVPAAAPPHNLPAQLTSFIGREAQLADLRQVLGRARLITLTGASGCGKTRLALELAAASLPAYADGVWLVELAALNDPALLPQTVAAALGLHEASGQPLDQVLARELRAKHLLLVLDNCEHLAEACRSLAEQLLRACPKLTILTTSREVLQIAGERIWPVPALATPDVEVAAPELLIAYESVQLFAERAGAANPAFALNASNAPAIAQICRRLDGLPLAIELAAARVRHMTVEEIAARLDDRFALLTTGSVAVPRQRTLRAAIDWSYSLLNPAEQGLLRRLAVFAGGCTVQSAEAMGALDDIRGRPATLELLSQLVDKSLLIVDQRRGATRYRLLETTRAYAHERLADAGELELAREWHLAYFVQLAEQAEPHLFGADQVAWLDRLALEHDNLRAAIDYAMERAAAAAALRLVTALRSFWYTRGHYDEGRQRILRALALPSAQAPTSARASALNAAGAMLWATGDAAEAHQLLDEALAIGRAIGDSLNAGWALLHLGTIAYQQNGYPAAQPLLEAGLADCRAAGAAGRRGMGWALIFLGDLAQHAGDARQARARFEESAALLRELADAGLLAYPLRRLGHLALRQGDFEAATAFCTESLRLNLTIDDRLAVAACLAALAAVAVAQGQMAGGTALTEHMRHAARLCGAVTAQLEIIGAPLWPADAAMLKATMAAASAHLGDGAFAAAAEGAAIPLDQLIERGADWARTR